MYSPDRQVQFALSCASLATTYQLVAEIDWETYEINFVGDIPDDKLQSFIGEIEFLAKEYEGEDNGIQRPFM